MNIQVDDREGDRISYAKQQYKQHNLTVEHLETGDFIFNKRVAFEYKTLPDFINSVQSGRIMEQCIRLNQNFDFPFVMIQGSEAELQDYINKIYFIRKSKKKNKPQKFYEKNFYGAINSLNRLVTVLRCPSQYLAFQSMINQANKCLSSAPLNRKVAKTGNPAYNCLRYCINGVGPKTAEKIVNGLDLKTARDAIDVSVDDLCSVQGIKKAKALLIKSQLG